MKVNKILDYGNCQVVRLGGKEAYVKVASLWTRTFYKADAMGKLAQHNETLISIVEVKSEAVQRKLMSLPREISITSTDGFKLPQNRGGHGSNVRVVYREVSRDHNRLLVEDGELKYRSLKQRNPRIVTTEGLNLRSGNNRSSL